MLTTPVALPTNHDNPDSDQSPINISITAFIITARSRNTVNSGEPIIHYQHVHDLLRKNNNGITRYH